MIEPLQHTQNTPSIRKFIETSDLFKIDLKSLWTNLQQKDYETWSFIKDKALTVRGFNKFAFLLTSNNKPCGAMSGSNIWGKCNLNYISTWPIEQNKKMPLIII